METAETIELNFNRTLTLKKQRYYAARFATVIRAITDGSIKAEEVHASLMGMMMRHGLISSGLKREVTKRGAAWLSTYDGDFVTVSEVVVSEITKQRKQPGRYQSREAAALHVIFQMVKAEPKQWVHVHLGTVDKLNPECLWLWMWLQVHGGKYETAEQVAQAIGWTADEVHIRIERIREGGFNARLGSGV